MQSIDFADFEPELVRPEGERLVSCPSFEVEKWELESARPASAEAALRFSSVWRALSRSALIVSAAGDFFLVPATAAATELSPAEPETSLLRVTLPAR